MMDVPLEVVIDAGNTRTKLGWYRRGRIEGAESLDTKDVAAIKVRLEQQRPVRAVIGSVAGHGELDRELRSFSPFVIDQRTPFPIAIDHDTPGTLGIDRIANAVAAARLFPDRPVLVIDAGTCITYDLVENSTFIGGAISPGRAMRSSAMHHYSARLPLIDPGDDPLPIGRSTTGALASGIHFGMLHELQGMIGMYGHQRPEMAVILTGGDALRSARALKSGIFAHPYLTLDGLYAIFLHNCALHRPAGGDRSAPAGPAR